MARSLDAVLKGEAPKPEAPTEPKAEVAEPGLEAEAPKAETPPEQKPDKARDESGKFVKGEPAAKPEAGTPPAKPAAKIEPSDPESGLKAGITAERKKRQDAERRAAGLQQRLEALQTPRQTPDVLADPEGFRKSITADIEAQRINDRVNLSAAMARELYPDFDEVMDEWAGIMQADPLIYQQAIKQDFPAKWAYQHVKRERFLKEVGDNPDNWRKAERERLRAELEPELKKQLEASTPKQPVPPPSLASASSGGRVQSDTAGVERRPFDKIFGR